MQSPQYTAYLRTILMGGIEERGVRLRYCYETSHQVFGRSIKKKI